MAVSMDAPTRSSAPQWQQEVWRRQQFEMVAIPSYVECDRDEAEGFLRYVARLRSSSSSPQRKTSSATNDDATTTTAATTSTTSASSAKKQKKKQTTTTTKQEKRSGSVCGEAGAGEKATSKRWKRRKQSLGEVAVSEEAATTTTTTTTATAPDADVVPAPRATPRRAREVPHGSVLEHRDMIQVQALASYNLLVRATSPVAEREA